ncbi:MAG: hypothetical protein AAGJ85_03860, partial [Pseudomonadota bacterium]
ADAAGQRPEAFIVLDPSNIRSVNAAFDPDRSDSSNLLAQSARGTFQPAGNANGRGVVTLFEARNLSTFMHEASHWYLDTLIELSAQGKAPTAIEKRLDAIFEWHGIDRDTKVYDDNGVPTQSGRELHEAFAETFEAYLREGKAPSAKLRDAFRAFKTWLTQLYRSLTQLRRANLTPEIRSVFDRMMAVDEEITAATRQTERTAEQMAQSLVDRGIITERQRKNAVKRLDAAREKAKEDLLARVMEDIERKNKAWWKTETERVRGQVVRQFDKSPVGRAMSVLGYGTWKGDVADVPGKSEAALYQTYDPKGHGEVPLPANVSPMRLDLAAVRRDYGESALRKIPSAIRSRSVSVSTVDDMMEVAETVAKTLKAKPPQTLIEFLRSNKIGGLRDEGGEITQAGDGVRGLINNKSGMSLDYAREAAEEAGFIRARDGDSYNRTTVQDFIDAIQQDASGDAVVREQDLADLAARQDAQAWAEWLDSQNIDIFSSDKRALKKAFADLVSRTGENAVSADVAAEALGFTSGEAMLNALAEVGNRERHIREEADRRMLEEFGDLMNDGTLTEEARRTAMNEVRGRQVEIELEALQKALGRNAAANLAKEMARERLSMMTVKQVMGYRKFLSASERWSRAALEATEKDDLPTAMLYKQRQLINMQLYREGGKLAEKLEKTQADLRKYETSDTRRKKIEPEYLQTIDDLLERYELRKSKQGPKEMRERESAREFVSRMDSEGREDEVSAEARLLAELANAKPFTSLTIDEVAYLKATIENLAHLGQTKQRMLNERESRRFDAVISSLVDQLEKAGPLKGAAREYSFRPTASERISRIARTAHAAMMRPEHQLKSLDQGDNGPLWNALFLPFSDAADVESRMSREAAKRLRKIYDMYSPTERYRMHNVSIELALPGKVGKRWTKMDVIAMALNWGVPYNRDALMEGYGWNKEQVEAVLFDKLSEKDWDFVEAIWEEMGRYKEESFALEKAITGVTPEAVEG